MTPAKPTLIQRLAAPDRAALLEHFIALARDDRRLRFGTPMGDAVLAEYVRRIDFARDGLFAVHDGEGVALVAVIHVARSERSAELGLSVLPGHRGQGLGAALFRRAVNYLRTLGMPEVFVHCLSENGAMMHLARKHGMRILPEGAETDARLALEPPDAHTLFTEWLHDYHAAAIRAVRANGRMAQALLRAGAPVMPPAATTP